MQNEWLQRISPCICPVRPGKAMTLYTAHSEIPPDWTEPLRVIYNHELVLFSKGRFVVEIENKPYACPVGTFIIVPPGKLHASWETAGQLAIVIGRTLTGFTRIPATTNRS